MCEMRTIPRSEWEAKHSDFKTVDEDGQYYVLRLDDNSGATVLEPVEIVNDRGETNDE